MLQLQQQRSRAIVSSPVRSVLSPSHPLPHDSPLCALCSDRRHDARWTKKRRTKRLQWPGVGSVASCARLLYSLLPLISLTPFRDSDPPKPMRPHLSSLHSVALLLRLVAYGGAPNFSSFPAGLSLCRWMDGYFSFH